MAIIVVDDNEQNLELMEAFLGGNGYQVVTAANGAEALTKARQNPPDLIISDILMPVMDGFALCREWKKDERLRQIPFVFYTATYTDQRDREFALSLGAERFLVKPMEPKTFVQTIREVIQQIQCPPAAPSRGPIEAPPEEEAGYLQQYNAVLIRKLEAKMQQLDQTNRELEQSLAERKQTEEAMRFANLVLSTQQETANDGILVVNEEARILSYNRRFVDMWGLPAKLVEDRVDEPVLQFVTAQTADPQSFSRRVQHLYACKQEAGQDEIILKDGRTFDRYSAPMFGADGKYYGRMWYFHDVTERKRAEEERKNLLEQLVRSEKLSAVGELISGVAHEINNPLTGIIGLSGLLLKENKENLDADTKKDLESIHHSSERIKKIVANLLRFARREAPVKKDVSVNELLDTVLTIRSYEMKVRNVEVIKHFQPDLSLVMADPSQLEQVFLNLIVNAEYAIHETGKTGTLTIATSLREEQPEHKKVVIEISDTGAGIPEAVFSKLFNPFFTTKPVGKGTGLGLSVSYGIIKEHGGEIHARNRKEGGAAFTIELPVSGG